MERSVVEVIAYKNWSEANDAKSKKRKALKKELEQLKIKKQRLQKDAEVVCEENKKFHLQ